MSRTLFYRLVKKELNSLGVIEYWQSERENEKPSQILDIDNSDYPDSSESNAWTSTSRRLIRTTFSV